MPLRQEGGIKLAIPLEVLHESCDMNRIRGDFPSGGLSTLEDIYFGLKSLDDLPALEEFPALAPSEENIIPVGENEVLEEEGQEKQEEQELAHVLRARLGGYGATSVERLAISVAEKEMAEADLVELDVDERKQIWKRIESAFSQEEG